MSSEISNKNLLEAPFMTLRKKEGILHCRYTENITIDLDIAMVCTQLRMDFSGALSYPVLFDIRGVKAITRQAREYLAGEGSQLMITGAFMADSPVSMLIGTIFQRVNRLRVPTRLFHEEAKALHWLRHHYQNN